MAVTAEWWADEAFWEELFDFIFPPEHLALGERVAAQVAALLGLRAGDAVLDLGCGPGRVAVPLARLGLRVVGVDAQRGYLARARDAAAGAGVALELREGNLGDLALAPEFDAVACLFTSFGYFAERGRDLQVLRRALGALRPAGRLLLQTAHRDGVVRTLRAREARLPDGRTCREEPRFDPVTGILHAVWTVQAPGGTRSWASRMRPYSATELDGMLREAGFREVRFHGDLDGGPPSLDAYEIVAVASR